MTDTPDAAAVSAFSDTFDAECKAITAGRQASQDITKLVSDTDPSVVAADLLAVMTEMSSWPMPENPDVIPHRTPEEVEVINRYRYLKEALASCQYSERPSREMLKQRSMPVLEAIRDAALEQLEQLKAENPSLAERLSSGLFYLFLKMDEVHSEFTDPIMAFGQQIVMSGLLSSTSDEEQEADGTNG